MTGSSLGQLGTTFANILVQCSHRGALWVQLRNCMDAATSIAYNDAHAQRCLNGQCAKPWFAAHLQPSCHTQLSLVYSKGSVASALETTVKRVKYYPPSAITVYRPCESNITLHIQSCYLGSALAPSVGNSVDFTFHE